MGLIGRRAIRQQARAGDQPSAIELAIDRIALDGFSGIDVARVGLALEAELARNPASLGQPSWGSGHAVDVVRTRSDLRPEARDRSSSVGAAIGQAVAAGIRDEQTSGR